MSDAVNEQHLAAMGLGAQPLGQAYQEAVKAEIEGRCPVVDLITGDQCALKEGHPYDVHIRGSHKWSVGPYYQVEKIGEPTKQREGDQVLPSGDESIVDDQALLIADIEERRQVGIQRYGQGHRPLNGRNTIQDFYEEMIDGAVYARSLLRVREATRDELVRAVRLALVQEQETAEPSFQRAAEVAVDRILDWAVLQKTQES